VQPRITVIAQVESNDSTLVELVESLDAQSLSYCDFDVVLLVPEGAVSLRRRLEQLAGRRPNVAIQPFDGPWSDALRGASAEVTAPSVLPLSPHLNGGASRLHPDALSRLADFLDTNECDVVFARASWSSEQAPIPFDLRHDVAPIGEVTARRLVGVATLVYRAEFIRTHRLFEDASDLDGIDASLRIGILGSYPVLAGLSGAVDSAPPDEDAVVLRVQNVTASWRNGRILLAVDPPNPEGNPPCLLSIRRSDSGLEYWLPTAPDAPSAWEIDIRSAALGAPLTDGQWALKSNAYTADGEPVARSPVPATPLATGVVDGKLVVPASVEGGFVIDVAGTHFPPVPSVDANQVQITEDARGALLTARLPNIHTTGPAVIDGAVTLDRFSLPARLAADHHEVSLQFFVSGLAGESTLSTQFGAAPAAPTGLNLVITGTGEISVAPTPAPPPAAPPKTTAPRKPAAPPNQTASRKPTKKAVAPKPTPMVTRLRRAVPEPLEPMARRLSRNDLARRVYRRMTQS
jgi:hypothetical protein